MTHPHFRNSGAHADCFRDVDAQTLHAHLGGAHVVDAGLPVERQS